MTPGSGSLSWFKRSESGSKLCRRSVSADGVELQRMASASSIAQLTGEDDKISKSQPLQIPDSSKVQHSHKPMQHTQQAAQQHVQGAAGSTSRLYALRDAQSTHPLQHQGTTMCSCGSTGLDLPSALTVPAAAMQQEVRHQQQEQVQKQQVQQQPASRSGHHEPSDDWSSQHQQQQEEAPDKEKPRPGKSSSRVRWLPGLSTDLDAQPGLGGQQQPAYGTTIRVMPGVSNGSPSSAPQAAGFDDAGSNDGAGRGVSAVAGKLSTSSRAAKAACLPPSGNAQLDKYLSYLLQEAHPHKYMYYPAWGVSDEGCASVGEFLRRDKRMKVMTLAGNDIRDEGVELIAEGLASNSCLLSLDLSDNKISNMGAIALAEALHSNKTLAELNLNHNRIGDEGAEALAAAVASNFGLKKLHLAGNPVTPAQQRVVQHVLKTREYKMPSGQGEPAASSRKGHVRKSSSLQFHIELTETDNGSFSRLRSFHLPPSTAIAALTEPTESIESSIAMQAAHVLSELHSISADSMLADAQGAAGQAAAVSGRQSSTGSTSSVGGSSNAKINEHDNLVCCLALRLSGLGYDVIIRRSCPSLEHGEEGAMKASEGVAMGLRHAFVRVKQPGETSSPLVVDPCFRELFVISHPTGRYQSVLDALPGTLVLLESRLYHLVEALCNEMAVAFQDQSMTCPPWRGFLPMLDKWLSKNKVDIMVDADSSMSQLQQALCAN